MAQGIKGLTGGGATRPVAVSFPDPPKFPDEMVKRFPELEKYQTEFKEWLKQFVTAIKK